MAGGKRLGARALAVAVLGAAAFGVAGASGHGSSHRAATQVGSEAAASVLDVAYVTHAPRGVAAGQMPQAVRAPAADGHRPMPVSRFSARGGGVRIGASSRSHGSSARDVRSLVRAGAGAGQRSHGPGAAHLRASASHSRQRARGQRASTSGRGAAIRVAAPAVAPRLAAKAPAAKAVVTPSAHRIGASGIATRSASSSTRRATTAGSGSAVPAALTAPRRTAARANGGGSAAPLAHANGSAAPAAAALTGGTAVGPRLALAPANIPTVALQRAVAEARRGGVIQVVRVFAHWPVAAAYLDHPGVAVVPATAVPATAGGPAGGGARQPARSGSAPSASPAIQYVFVPQLITRTVPRLVSKLPATLWAALAVALTLAAVAGTAAFVFARRARRQGAEAAAATAAALTDPLTGALNRRGFTEAVERELARSRRYDRPFMLAYADVRGLKAVNDSKGHLAGDELIQGVARMMTESARAHDVVGRLGGDEFALLLPEHSGCDADAVTERIHALVKSSRATLGSKWDLTIGTASFPCDGQTADELIAVADRRLYEQRGIELARAPRRSAKSRGRTPGAAPVGAGRA